MNALTTLKHIGTGLLIAVSFLACPVVGLTALWALADDDE